MGHQDKSALENGGQKAEWGVKEAEGWVGIAGDAFASRESVTKKWSTNGGRTRRRKLLFHVRFRMKWVRMTRSCTFTIHGVRGWYVFLVQRGGGGAS